MLHPPPHRLRIVSEGVDSPRPAGPDPGAARPDEWAGTVDLDRPGRYRVTVTFDGTRVVVRLDASPD